MAEARTRELQRAYEALQRQSDEQCVQKRRVDEALRSVLAINESLLSRISSVDGPRASRSHAQQLVGGGARWGSAGGAGGGGGGGGGGFGGGGGGGLGGGGGGLSCGGSLSSGGGLGELLGRLSLAPPAVGSSACGGGGGSGWEGRSACGGARSSSEGPASAAADRAAAGASTWLLPGCGVAALASGDYTSGLADRARIARHCADGALRDEPVSVPQLPLPPPATAASAPALSDAPMVGAAGPLAGSATAPAVAVVDAAADVAAGERGAWKGIAAAGAAAGAAAEEVAPAEELSEASAAARAAMTGLAPAPSVGASAEKREASTALDEVGAASSLPTSAATLPNPAMAVPAIPAVSAPSTAYSTSAAYAASAAYAPYAAYAASAAYAAYATSAASAASTSADADGELPAIMLPACPPCRHTPPPTPADIAALARSAQGHICELPMEVLAEGAAARAKYSAAGGGPTVHAVPPMLSVPAALAPNFTRPTHAWGHRTTAPDLPAYAHVAAAHAADTDRAAARAATRATCPAAGASASSGAAHAAHAKPCKGVGPPACLSRVAEPYRAADVRYVGATHARLREDGGRGGAPSNASETGTGPGTGTGTGAGTSGMPRWGEGGGEARGRGPPRSLQPAERSTSTSARGRAPTACVGAAGGLANRGRTSSISPKRASDREGGATSPKRGRPKPPFVTGGAGGGGGRAQPIPNAALGYAKPVPSDRTQPLPPAAAQLLERDAYAYVDSQAGGAELQVLSVIRAVEAELTELNVQYKRAVAELRVADSDRAEARLRARARRAAERMHHRVSHGRARTAVLELPWARSQHQLPT